MLPSAAAPAGGSGLDPGAPDLFAAPAPAAPAVIGRVSVWVARALDRVLDYSVPADLAAADARGGLPPPGQLVLVPLGPTQVPGIVTGPGGSDLPPARLKPLSAVSDLPPLDAATRQFLQRAADYTLTPVGMIARMTVPIPGALLAPAPEIHYGLPAQPPPVATARSTPARRRVVDALANAPGPLPRATLARLAGVGPAVVSGLIASGHLAAVPVVQEWQAPRPDPAAGRAPALSPAQAQAAARLVAAVAAERFQAILLDGVTGSGKTEVYLEAVAAAMARGRQSLVLIPEIALTSQWLDRFAARFGCAPVVWHSGLPPAERARSWRAIARGQAAVVIGARSALYLPLPALGLVVIDEEHDHSYKQEDGALYHARDMGVLRAACAGVPIVLASATPSLETERNARDGRYRRLVLPARFGRAVLPDVGTVDLRRDPPPRGRWLAPPLLAAMQETLAAGQQVLLFLNRRGFAPLTLCRACGARIACHQCDSWMVEHRLRAMLMCHVCGAHSAIPSACPSCGAGDALVPCGPGVERIEQEVDALFPQARRLILSSDTAGSAARLRAMIQAITLHQVDLVVGTQVVAKGHTFPDLTLVGVVDADLGLGGGDLRAAERTFQVLHQVGGRAGRAALPGRVLIQTRQPDHPVLRALIAGDRDGFFTAELAARAAAGMPPYGRMVALIVSARDPVALDQACAQLARARPDRPGVMILGPAEPPLAMIRGQHRRRFLVVAERTVPVQALILGWLGAVRLAAAVRVQVDVDPVSFL